MYGNVYLASPLGFSKANDAYRRAIRQRLEEHGLHVLDPWEADWSAEIADARSKESYNDEVKASLALAKAIGEHNQLLITASSHVLGVLDGAEVDSGTASEIGFARGLGKRCWGLRTDFRDTGDMLGVPVNLQVLHWIESSGGKLFRDIGAIDITERP